MTYEPKPKYPVEIYGVVCNSHEDVQRLIIERRDDPDRDRTPLRFTVTTTYEVELDPMWLDDEGRLMWDISPLMFGGRLPLKEEYRKTPAEWLKDPSRSRRTEVLTWISSKTTVKQKGRS
jgi:hypothetical protein